MHSLPLQIQMHVMLGTATPYTTVSEAGDDRRRAWSAARKVIPTTNESCTIEASAIQLLLSRSGGITVGSPEHREAMTRLDELEKLPQVGPALA